MDQSPTIAALAAALSKAQSALANVKKTKTAKIPTKSGASYSYTYADLADVWDAIRKPLADNGLAVIQAPETFDSGMGVVTTITHESGEWISSVLIMPVADRTPQALGSVITYLRRYGLCAMLGIVSDDDTDTQEDRQKAPQQPQRSGASYDRPQAPIAAQKPAQTATGPQTQAEWLDLLQAAWDKELTYGGTIPEEDQVSDMSTLTIDEIKARGKKSKERLSALQKAAKAQPKARVEDLL